MIECKVCGFSNPRFGGLFPFHCPNGHVTRADGRVFFPRGNEVEFRRGRDGSLKPVIPLGEKVDSPIRLNGR